VDRLDDGFVRSSFSALGDGFDLGDEKLDQATSTRKRRKNKLRVMILMLMGDWFLLGLMVLDVSGFSLDRERERERERKRLLWWVLDDELRPSKSILMKGADRRQEIISFFFLRERYR
jgi:hypothetical protein